MRSVDRLIVLEENKNGSFRCRDGIGGPEFGRAASLSDAYQVTVEYLTMQGFDGVSGLLLKPWRTTPFTQELTSHSFKR